MNKFDFKFNYHISTLENGLKIYVPDALYDEWIVTTNWVQWAKYIRKASEKPSD